MCTFKLNKLCKYATCSYVDFYMFVCKLYVNLIYLIVDADDDVQVCG